MSDETDAGEVMEDVADETPLDEETDPAAEEAAGGDDEPAEEHEEPVPDPAKAKPKEQAKLAKTYRAKINGREEEVPASLTLDELAQRMGVQPEELLRGPASMLKAGQERLRKAAEAEKRARALEEKLKSDPKALLREALGDEGVLQLAIQSVQEAMEAERLAKENPAELERRKTQAELDKLKAEREALAKQQEEEQVSKEQAQVISKVDTEIKGLLEKGGIAPTTYAVSRLASHMLEHAKAMEAGDTDEDLNPADFVPLVEEDLRKEHTRLYGEMSGEQFAKAFPEMAEKVRQYHLGAVRRPRTPGHQPETKPRQKSEQHRYTSIAQVLKDL